MTFVLYYFFNLYVIMILKIFLYKRYVIKCSLSMQKGITTSTDSFYF